MFSIFKKAIYILLSYTPILSVTRDSNFGTNTEKFIEDNKVINGTRFSLFNIHLGKIKVYMVTYSLSETNDKRFNFIKVLDLDNLIMPNNFIELNDKKATEYEIHYKNLKSEEGDIELEFIKYKINDEKERIKKAESKITLYTSIILVLIPIIIGLYKPEKIYEDTLLGIILSLCLIMCTINTVCFILQQMFVKSLTLSSFNDIKTSKYKSEQNANNYYFEWQVIKKRSDLDVSYVKNIQYWMIGIIMIFIMFYYNSLITPNNNLNMNNKDSVYTININNLDSKYSEDVKKVSEIHIFITDMHPKEIILLYGQYVDIDDLNKMCKQFDIYKDINIYKIIDNDFEDKDIIKVIIKEE